MNIAVFIKRTTFHSGYGGLETQNKALCEGLISRGHSVTVLSPKLELMKETETLNGVKYEFVDCSFRSLAGLAFLDPNNWVNKSVARFRVLNDRERFDIVLGQSSAALGIIRKKNQLGIKVVSISHGTAGGEIKTRVQSVSGLADWLRLTKDLFYFVINFFGRQRVFVQNSNKIIAVSNAVKRSLIEETFIPEEKVEVIYNGLNLRGADYTQEEKDIDILYVGQALASKGLGDLVAALKYANLNSVKVGIVGDGIFLTELKNMVTKNNLANSFEFFGKQESNQVLKLMRRSKVFVLPSRRLEGMPMALIEAAFMELPVVASDMGGIPEVVENGRTGIIYPAGNVQELALGISKLLSDEDLRSEMSKNTKERAQKFFSLDKMLNDYEKVLEGILR